MLRLKGRVVYGELEGDWIKFDANQIDGVAGDGIGLRVRSSDRNIFIVDPSTIQPAEDPRKQMLDEIKCEIMCRQNKPKNDFEKGWEAALANLVTSIDEMEAKL